MAIEREKLKMMEMIFFAFVFTCILLLWCVFIGLIACWIVDRWEYFFIRRKYVLTAILLNYQFFYSLQTIFSVEHYTNPHSIILAFVWSILSFFITFWIFVASVSMGRRVIQYFKRSR
ncbi:hypothetical protein [Candidatus Liberibacter asiaticus]|nr:hypothetical protein [Candidatus Liberibacter asiaticus]